MGERVTFGGGEIRMVSKLWRGDGRVIFAERNIYTESKENLIAESLFSHYEGKEEVTYVEWPREKYVPTAADDLPETISLRVMRSIAYLTESILSLWSPFFFDGRRGVIVYRNMICVQGMSESERVA